MEDYRYREVSSFRIRPLGLSYRRRVTTDRLDNWNCAPVNYGAVNPWSNLILVAFIALRYVLAVGIAFGPLIAIYLNRNWIFREEPRYGQPSDAEFTAEAGTVEPLKQKLPITSVVIPRPAVWMTVGVAVTLRLIGSVFGFVADLFYGVADLAQYSGDPEISAFGLALVVGLWVSGRPCTAVICLLGLSVVDLIQSDRIDASLGWGPYQ